MTSHCLIITGMHRSGTSLAAAVLRGAGVHLGERLVAPDSANAAGYFENRDFVEFHQQVLKAQGRHWAGWTVQPPGPITAEFADEARRLVRANARPPLWGWKDPRTTLFLEFWAELLPAARYLLVYRSPWEVADSLYRRGNPGDDVFVSQPELAIQLWLHYNRRLIEFFDGHRERCLLVSLEGAAEPSRKLIAELNARFALALPDPAGEIQNPALWHAEATEARRDLEVQERFPECLGLLAELRDRAAWPAAEPLAGRAAPRPFHDWMNLRWLQRERRWLDTDISRHKQYFEQQQQTIAQQQQSIAAQQRHLGESQQQLTEQRRVQANVEVQLRSTQDQLQSLLQSRSWRLTAPLRDVVRFFRRRRLQSGLSTYRLGPLRQLWDSKRCATTRLRSLTPAAIEAGPHKPGEAVRWISSLLIGGQAQEALFLHAPASVTYRLTVPPRGRLRGCVALHPDVWDRAPDGVEFHIRIQSTTGPRFVEHRRRIRVAPDGHHQQWNEWAVGLRAFANQTIELTLAVSVPNAGPVTYAWAVWGEPTIEARKSGAEIGALCWDYLRGKGPAGVVDRLQRVTRQHQAPALAPAGRVSQSDLGPVAPRCRTMALYCSSEGNYFFREIRDLLAAGFAELGFEVRSQSETDGFHAAADWHIVVAPHEFFHLGAGRKIRPRELPSQLVLVNTEQPTTHWFALAREMFGQARAVWDINHESAQNIRRLGSECDYLPLGHVPGFAAYGPVPVLPVHRGSCCLEPSAPGAPWPDRPIDVAFVGQLTPRREQFFARAAAVLADYRCYLSFSDGLSPVIPGKTTALDTATVIGLMQRSKILLNLHRTDETYFEWHRIVLHGIWQRALVISEPCTAAPPFAPHVDYVEAGLDEMPEKIRYLLTTPDGQQAAQETVERAHAKLTGACRLADHLRTLVMQLYVPRSQTSFWERHDRG